MKADKLKAKMIKVIDNQLAGLPANHDDKKNKKGILFYALYNFDDQQLEQVKLFINSFNSNKR